MTSIDKASQVAVATPNIVRSAGATPVRAAVRAAEDKKAVHLRVLDLREVCDFADTFLIATGTNARQVQAISESVKDELRALGARPIAIEGFRTATWVLLDYGDLVVHVFQPETRAFYGLERLWSDAHDTTAQFATPAPQPLTENQPAPEDQPPAEAGTPER